MAFLAGSSPAMVFLVVVDWVSVLIAEQNATVMRSVMRNVMRNVMMTKSVMESVTEMGKASRTGWESGKRDPRYGFRSVA